MAVSKVWKPTESFYWGDGIFTLAVMHITAGATTNANLAPFIQNPDNAVSYHYSVDNISGDNLVYNYVNPSNGDSWSCCDFNHVSLNICLCAPASAVDWSREEWLAQGHMLKCAAAILGEDTRRFGIPLVALSAAQAQSGVPGVCQHRDLGEPGCGHSDCGPNFPMDELLRLAKGDQPVPVPPPVVRYGEDYEPMQLTYGPDGKCAVEMPKDVIALRLGCSQGGTVNVQWPGKSDPTRTYDLSGYKRQDVPTPVGQTVNAALTGQCIIYRPGAEANPPAGVGPDPGPVSATWVAK